MNERTKPAAAPPNEPLLPPQAVDKIGERLAHGVFAGRRGHGNAPACEIHLKQDELAALLGAAFEGGYNGALGRSTSTPAPTMGNPVRHRPDDKPLYVASRASMGLRPAKWRELRAAGWPILSTWIDEAGDGETQDWGQLWTRIVLEVSQACGVILWAEQGDFPLKGAFVEVGIALGQGKRVAVCTRMQVRGPRFQPFGSWLAHPSVRLCSEFEAARRWVQDGVEPQYSPEHSEDEPSSDWALDARLVG